MTVVGALACCADGACWKPRCQTVGDGDPKDRHDLCEQPVQVTPDLRIPRCMEMISPEDVIRRIEMYYEGGILRFENDLHVVNGTIATEIAGTNGLDPIGSAVRTESRSRVAGALRLRKPPKLLMSTTRGLPKTERPRHPPRERTAMCLPFRKSLPQPNPRHNHPPVRPARRRKLAWHITTAWATVPTLPI